MVGTLIFLTACTILLYCLSRRFKKIWHRLEREQRSAMFASLLMLGGILAIFWYSVFKTLLEQGQGIS